MKLLIVLLAFGTAAAAQGVYKCRDAAGRITYSGSECHLMGLTSAGEVTDRSSVAPAFKPPADRPGAVAERARTPPAPGAPAAASQSAATPAAPEKRCFAVTRVVKGAKGNTTVTSTHCNDTPDEKAASQ